jgi:hypothetical protein
MDMRGSCNGETRGMRGQVYSLIAILMVIPLVFFITQYMVSVQTLKFGTSERIIADQLKETQRSIETDFSRAVQISGIRACLGATDYMIREGEPLDDAEARLGELILNGTLFGNQTYVMEDNTIDDWRDDIYSITPGFSVLIGYSNFTLQNYNGFYLVAGIRLRLNISDKLEIARISKNVDKTILIPLENIEDPMFPYRTGGVFPRTIRFYPYPYHAMKIVSGSLAAGNCSGNVTYDASDPDPAGKILVANNASGVSGFAGVVAETADTPSVSCSVLGASGAVGAIQSLLNQSGYPELYLDEQTGGVWSLPINDALGAGYYSHFTGSSGPDLLQRLEGDFGESANGMETFVNIPELQSQGISTKADQVSLAYLYFSSQTHAGVPVRGLPDWFRMDSSHASRYNLTELM